MMKQQLRPIMNFQPNPKHLQLDQQQDQQQDQVRLQNLQPSRPFL